jgi:hypothetical protein
LQQDKKKARADKEHFFFKLGGCKDSSFSCLFPKCECAWILVNALRTLASECATFAERMRPGTGKSSFDKSGSPYFVPKALSATLASLRRARSDQKQSPLQGQGFGNGDAQHGNLSSPGYSANFSVQPERAEQPGSELGVELRSDSPREVSK